MKYLLDTNICAYLKRYQPPEIVERFRQLERGDVGISSITLGELEYGIHRSPRPEHDRAILEELLELLLVLPFDVEAARHFGEIRAGLERLGTPIGPFDLQIAAHARSLGVVLVTHNLREFRRVPDLQVEDWHPK